MVVVPIPGDFLESFLLESVEFLQSDNVGFLFGDPLRTDLRGLAMVKAVEDVVSEDAERFSLGSMDTDQGSADEQGADHGFYRRGEVRILHSLIIALAMSIHFFESALDFPHSLSLMG